MSDWNISCEKMSDFVSFPLFGFTLVIKLRNFDFESHQSTLLIFYEKDMVSDLNMSHGKTTDFVSFSLFEFTLIIKLRAPSQKKVKFYLWFYVFLPFL